MDVLDRLDEQVLDAVPLAVIGAVLVLVLWLCARILRRAGIPGWLALLVLIPGWNLVAVWALAFLPWPAELRRGRPGRRE